MNILLNNIILCFTLPITLRNQCILITHHKNERMCSETSFHDFLPPTLGSFLNYDQSVRVSFNKDSIIQSHVLTVLITTNGFITWRIWLLLRLMPFVSIDRSYLCLQFNENSRDEHPFNVDPWSRISLRSTSNRLLCNRRFGARRSGGIFANYSQTSGRHRTPAAAAPWLSPVDILHLRLGTTPLPGPYPSLPRTPSPWCQQMFANLSDWSL